MIFRAICISLLCAQAQALPITIEPDDYQPGSVLPQDLGAKIRFISHDRDAPEFTYSDAIVTDCSRPAGLDCHAVTGSNALGHAVVGSGPLLQGFDHFPTSMGDISRAPYFTALLIEFDNPTDWFAAVLNNNSSDTVAALAFSSDGRIIGTKVANLTRRDWNGPGYIGDYVLDVSIDSFAPDIAMILLGSYSAAAYVDAMTFNRIPEPSSIVMLSVGLLGLLVRRVIRINGSRNMCGKG